MEIGGNGLILDIQMPFNKLLESKRHDIIMDSIKFSLFDLFSYALPGMLSVIALFIAILPADKEILFILEYSQELKIGTGILFVFVSYVVGFAIDSPASLYFYYPAVSLFKKKKNITASYAAEYRILAMHYSPENYKFIQLWKLLKTMSHNLSFVFILMSFACGYHFVINTSDKYSLIASIISIFLSVALLHRAYFFAELADVAAFQAFADFADCAGFAVFAVY